MTVAGRQISPIDCPEGFQFGVVRMGEVASRILSGARAGRVAAVFESSFYIESNAGWVCVGAAGLPLGPLNLAASAPDRTDWSQSGVRAGDRVAFAERMLSVGSRFRFMLRGAEIWRPARLSVPRNPEILAQGLSRLREACTGRFFGEGLGELIHRQAEIRQGSRDLGVAAPIVGRLRDWLIDACRGRRGSVAVDVEGLLGLGPGLTPSGDDLLGGVMIALHALDEKAMAEKLWKSIQPRSWRTGPISRAHLEAAALGQGHIDLHRAMEAMHSGCLEGLGGVLAGVDGIGHTSGWDAMAGAVLAHEAWLTARGS